MFHVFRDDANRRISVTVTGVATFGEVAQFLNTVRSTDIWDYGVLYDFRTATIDLTEGDLQQLAEHVDTLNQPRPRGRVAVVSTDPGVAAIREAYAALVRPAGIEVALFSDRVGAEQWLDERVGS